MTCEKSVAEARERCYFCEMDRSEDAAWAAFHPPKMSLLNLSSSFPFFLLFLSETMETAEAVEWA